MPLHVTLKLAAGVPSFRRAAIMRVVRAAIAAGGHRGDFRVVHYNVLGDHLHLVVEAAGAAALARGMQGLSSASPAASTRCSAAVGACWPSAITRARGARRPRCATPSATCCSTPDITA